MFFYALFRGYLFLSLIIIKHAKHQKALRKIDLMLIDRLNMEFKFIKKTLMDKNVCYTAGKCIWENNNKNILAINRHRFSSGRKIMYFLVRIQTISIFILVLLCYTYYRLSNIKHIRVINTFTGTQYVSKQNCQLFFNFFFHFYINHYDIYHIS